MAVPVAAVVYFGVAFFAATPVTAAIETREGIRQRAAAAEKVIRYDDWMDTQTRKGGWIKPFLLWPIEPDEYEIKGAAEFAGLVFQARQHAKGCGSVGGYGPTVSDDQVAMIGGVADYVQGDDVQWQEPAPLTIVAGLESLDKC